MMVPSGNEVASVPLNCVALAAVVAKVEMVTGQAYEHEVATGCGL